MTGAILTLNAGSSSIKYSLYRDDDEFRRLAGGGISGVGVRPVFEVIDASGMKRSAKIDANPRFGYDDLIEWLLDWIGREYPELTIIAAGHRVVHGGREHLHPTLLTPQIMSVLEALSPLAPDHQPINLAGVRRVAGRRPDIPQIACFDTAFHRTQPRLAQLYGLPRDLTDDGVLRYGFHGLSYESIAANLPAHAGHRAEGRVIVAHLGHGASMCAMVGRESRATTMGFTALDGLVMGTRCGDLDPGIILHLIRERNMTPDAVEHLLAQRSGLLGVSGVSADMRTLLRSSEDHAREAVDLFIYRAGRAIGSLASAIGGLDVLVFTGGIGENSAEIRARIASTCAWLGVNIDDTENQSGARRISARDSAVDVFALPTDEEGVIARHVQRLVRRASVPHDRSGPILGAADD